MAEHPESLEHVKSITITDAIKGFVTDLARQIEEEKTHRAGWEQRMDRYFHLRYGLRPKRNHPWPGAANYVLPLIDTDINRLKPAYVQLYTGVTPAVTFEPFGPEDVEPARKREQLFDWRLHTHVHFLDPYLIGIDQMLEKGFTVFKTTWRYETRTYTKFFDLNELDSTIVRAFYDEEALRVIAQTRGLETTDDAIFYIIAEELRPDMSFEDNVQAMRKAVQQFREGQRQFEFTFIEKAHDHPEVVACDPKEELVVPVDTTELNDARFIDYRFWKTTNQLKIAMRDEQYESYPPETIESWMHLVPPQSKWPRNIREGVSEQGRTNLLLLHETCCWYDVNGDGIDERCIATWPDAAPQEVLRFIELPYDHGEWPYVQVARERTDTGFYSPRGIPALDDDLQTGISEKFNHEMNNQTIVNTPTVVYRKGSGFNPRALRYIPGQPVEVEAMDDFDIRPGGNTSQGTFLTTAQYLKAWANERVGNIASGLSVSTNLPGLGLEGKRTAKEIHLIETLQGQTQSLDLQVFQYAMAKIYAQIDALYEQFGPDEEEFFLTGQGKVTVSRREIQGKFNLVPNGRLDNSNPVMRAAKTFQIYQLFAADPDIRQYELKRLVLTDLDIRLAERLLLSPEELAQRDAVLQTQGVARKTQAVQEQVALRRLSDSLDLAKEEQLAVIQGRRFAPGS